MENHPPQSWIENSFFKNLVPVFYLVAAATAETANTRNGKFSVLNVIRFPNIDCQGTGSLNGTCYTGTECTSLGGSASGACASSFGVCCVFSLACGATTSQNGTYAIINSFSTSTDTDPCIYNYCKNNENICKLRWGQGEVSFNFIIYNPNIQPFCKELIMSPWYSLGQRHPLVL